MRNRLGRKENVKGRLDIHLFSYLIDEWITNRTGGLPLLRKKNQFNDAGSCCILPSGNTTIRSIGFYFDIDDCKLFES